MPEPIVFGTDGWRGRIARELTFESAMRVVGAIASWTGDPENPDPGDPTRIVLVHDTRFLSPELASEAAALLA
ncbi:MAG TPA: phosphoglucomutase/phosphomannomutase family protein, partial [Thermoanaerobaculia bacterium]|nr:phosphoglucomutase/phosphomannomutase family protein [Thermoanaerobaculia bacterium]